MRKTITVLTIILLVLFMVGCENSVNPINSDNPTTSISQANNASIIAAKPFVGENSGIVAKKGPKGPKPQKPNELYVPNEYTTIQDAIDAANEGDIIFVGPGTFSGAVVNKGVVLRGVGDPLIDFGPPIAPGAPLFVGFLFPDDYTGNNAEISHFNFDLEFGIFSRGADNVVVEHCDMYNPIQGITNWAGNGWKISHNKIRDLRTRCGGGIGIFIGDRVARVGGIFENFISHNSIEGTLNVMDGDCGGYSGTGIVLYSDSRGGNLGAVSINNNTMEFNKVSLISDTPEVVDVVGIELTDVLDDENVIVIYDNTITKNKLKGTAISFSYTPITLEGANYIFKNIVN